MIRNVHFYENLLCFVVLFQRILYHSYRLSLYTKIKTYLYEKCYQKAKVLLMLVMSITIIASFVSPMYSGYASTENKTLMQSQGIPDIIKN
jgi:hypothetical protein